MTQETPFVLAFGTEVEDPVEVGLKSSRIELANIEHNEEALFLNLDLKEEKCEQALKRVENYHGRQRGIMTKGSSLGVTSQVT